MSLEKQIVILVISFAFRLPQKVIFSIVDMGACLILI